MDDGWNELANLLADMIEKYISVLDIDDKDATVRDSETENGLREEAVKIKPHG